MYKTFQEAADAPLADKETNREEAKRIVKNYGQRIRRTCIKASAGDDKAARDVIKLMTEKNVKLRELGWRRTNEYETPANTLVPITQEWIDQVEAAKTELDRLREKARDTQDPEDIRKFIRAFSQGTK